jgi:hypothetical protein
MFEDENEDDDQHEDEGCGFPAVRPIGPISPIRLMDLLASSATQRFRGDLCHRIALKQVRQFAKTARDPDNGEYQKQYQDADLDDRNDGRARRCSRFPEAPLRFIDSDRLSGCLTSCKPGAWLCFRVEQQLRWRNEFNNG